MGGGYSKENRQYYISRGKCPTCFGKNPVVPGMKQCADCQAKKREQQRQMTIKRRAEGRCTRCGGPLEDDHLTCSKCRKYHSQFSPITTERLHIIYNNRKINGKCTRCGKTWAEPGKTQCKKCLMKNAAENKRYDPDGAKKRERRQARIAAGLCIDCGLPTVDGYKRCKKCMESRRDSARKYEIHKRTLKSIGLAK